MQITETTPPPVKAPERTFTISVNERELQLIQRGLYLDLGINEKTGMLENTKVFVAVSDFLVNARVKILRPSPTDKELQEKAKKAWQEQMLTKVGAPVYPRYIDPFI